MYFHICTNSESLLVLSDLEWLLCMLFVSGHVVFFSALLYPFDHEFKSTITDTRDYKVELMKSLIELEYHLVFDFIGSLCWLEQEVSAAAHKLAVAVVEKCADKLEPYVQRFLTSVMLEGKVLDSGLHEDYHEVIYEIYCCAPQMLLAVIPNLTQELVVHFFLSYRSRNYSWCSFLICLLLYGILLQI